VQVPAFLAFNIFSRRVAIDQPANAVAVNRGMGDVLSVEQHGASCEKYRIDQVQAIFPNVYATPFLGRRLTAQ
jgi:hypothetical protein